MGESYLWQLRLKKLRYNKKYLSRHIDINKIGICIPNNPSRTAETTFLGQFWNLFTVSRKQQQIFIICCWQYHIRSQRTRLPQQNRWKQFSMTILEFRYIIHIFSLNLHKTISKLRNSDSAHSIFFGQVILKLFTFS